MNNIKSLLTAYFGGMLSPEEEARVQQWLALHGEEEEVSAILSGLFDDCIEMHNAISGSQKKGHIATQAKTRTFIACAASFAAAVCLVLPFTLFNHKNNDSDHGTNPVEWLELRVPNGKTSELTLCDGSVIHLNSGSRITYPTSFSGPIRQVFLEGEIYAEVAKNPECPFVISSGDSSVKVFGTTFNYKSYTGNDCVEIILVDGSVQFDAYSSQGTRSVMMVPGNLVQFKRGTGKVDISNFKADSFIPFFEKHSMHFFNLPMADIAKDLERTFNTHIIFMDSKVAKNKYFAIFSNGETLDQMLKAMNADNSMRITHRDGAIYLSSK